MIAVIAFEEFEGVFYVVCVQHQGLYSPTGQE